MYLNTIACRFFSTICLLLILAIVYLAGIPVLLAETENIQSSVPSDQSSSIIEIGVAGVWKPGVWTPVVLPESLVPNGSAQWSIEATDDDGLTVSYPADGRTGRFRIGTVHGSITLKGLKKSVALTDPFSGSSLKNGSLTVLLPAAANSHQKIYLVIGSEQEAEFVRRSIARLDLDKKARPLVVRLDSPESLSGDYLSLQVIDQIICFDRSSKAASSFPAASCATLNQWVRSGGNLILAMGDPSNAQETIQQGSPDSASSVPTAPSAFSFPSVDRLVNTTALEEFAGSDIPIPRLGLGKKYAIPVRSSTPPADAIVLCRYLDWPLIYRYTNGFGQTTVLMFDLGHESILKWSNREKLLRRVLDIPEKILETQAFSTNAILHYGYDDLPGQLASALDQFPGVPCLSFWPIAGALLIYILLVGAGDYFLWRRLSWPVQLSWVSFPIYAILFCALFYYLAIEAKGGRILANSVAVCDTDMATGAERVYFYGAVFVPNADRYTIQPQFDGKSFDWAGWFGSTGQGISGMNYPARFTARSDDAYSLQSTPKTQKRQGSSASQSADSIAELNGIPLANWMSRNLVAGTFLDQTAKSDRSAGENQETNSSALLHVSLRDDLGKPVGELENRSKKVWEDSLLVYGDWAFPLGKLVQGQKIEINDSLERFSLDAVLVGKRVKLTDVDVSEKYSNETQPYNPTDQDIVNIVRTILFYSASGGLSYTRLENGYQVPTDFSSLIKTNRAVLLVRETNSDHESATKGSSANSSERLATGVRVQNGFFPSRWIFRRFVIPVVPAEDK